MTGLGWACKPPGVNASVFVPRTSISGKQPYLCVPLRTGLRAWQGGRAVSARVVCVWAPFLHLDLRYLSGLWFMAVLILLSVYVCLGLCLLPAPAEP